MSRLPLITSILTVPGAGTGPNENVSVGLVLDGERVAWGQWFAAPATQDGAGFRAAEVAATIQARIIPALQGQPLTGFRELAERVDGLTETVTGQGSRVSRRQLITGQLSAAAEPAHPPTRPIHPALRCGVSQALLAAVALALGLTMAEVIAEEYRLPRPASAIPIHAEIPPGETADRVLQLRPASLGLSLTVQDAEAQLGGSGELLQRFTRQLAALISQAAGEAYRPVLYLDVQGGLGRLYANDLGKVLGALYGLERVAAPYPLRVADPLRLDSRREQIQKLAQLKDLLRLRGMSLQLVAGAWVDSAADARAFVEAKAVDGLQLDVERLGSLHQSVEAVLAGRQLGAAVILAGRDPLVAAHVALATRPDVVMSRSHDGEAAGVAALRDEMARTLAWLTSK